MLYFCLKLPLIKSNNKYYIEIRILLKYLYSTNIKTTFKLNLLQKKEIIG